jgi:DNA-binding NarL/FixJ family response regulator
MTSISALSTDLLDRSKFPAGTAFVRTADALDGGADVVVVDLARPDALDGVRRLRDGGSAVRIVAFGRHTEGDRLAEARAAGCDEVLARSEFFADVAAVLS